MKIKALVISLLLVVGLACAISFQATAQGQGGGFGGGARGMGMRGGGLTQEQMTKISEAVQADMAALNTKLADAEKAAVTAALAKDATEASIKAKIDAVIKIQMEIAMLKFTKGVKAIASTITDEQKTQMDASPGTAYQQLFGSGGTRGGFGGGAGGRGGFGNRGGQGGAGGAGGGNPGNL
jgi:Spy/CpxP family protein refolding chaperone